MTVLVAIAAVVIFATGIPTARFLAGSRHGWLTRPRVPVVALTLLVVTLISNFVQWRVSGYLGTMERHHGDLSAGHIWKILSPLLIQSDGLSQFITNTIAFIVVVPVTELALGSLPVAILYLVGGGIGQLVSFWWYPVGGGNSVAVISVLAGLYAALMLDHHQPVQMRIVAAVGVLAIVVLAIAEDQHGIAGLAGIILGTVMVLAHLTRPLPLDHPLMPTTTVTTKEPTP